jgi:hypothetical protein
MRKEKADSRERVPRIVMRVCSANALESTIPADRKASCARHQRDDCSQKEQDHDAGEEQPFPDHGIGIKGHLWVQLKIDGVGGRAVSRDSGVV